MAEPSLNLGNGNWAGKSGNLLAYHKANNNFYADELTFARASTGTIVNADGLIEQVPYNLVTYSEQFDNAGWSKTGVTVTANSITSPSGNMNADTLAFGASGNEIVQSVSGLTVGQDYTLSIYLKVASGTTTMSFGNISYATTSITVTSEWQRFTVTQSAVSATRYPKLVCTESVNVYAYGAQLNSGSTAKTYYPTTTRLNVPRVDYLNNANGSLLLEPQRTNSITNSEEFGSTGWSGFTTGTAISTIVTDNYAISPDGTQNAQRVQFNLDGGTTSSDRAVIRQGLASQTDWFLSVWMKSTNGTDQNILWHTGGDGNQTTVTGEWQRYTLSQNSITNGWAGLALRGGVSSVDTADILVYGFQAEQGSYPTSYIPTSGTTVTRLADSCSQTGLSDVIGQTEGTLFVDVDFTNRNELGVMIELSNGASNRVLIYYSSSAIICYANAAVFSYTQSTNEQLKIAFAYKSGDSTLYVNGVQKAVSSAALTYTGLSKLNVGSNFANLQPVANTTRQAQLYKTRLTNAELATLTT